jgi:hypothetical protein
VPTVFDAAVEAGDAIVSLGPGLGYEVLPTINASAVMCVVAHGATASTARTPVDAGAVYWIGTVTPTNAIAGDLYVNTSTGAITLIYSITVDAEATSGTGTAHSATLSIAPAGAVASGTGTANNATVTTSTADPSWELEGSTDLWQLEANTDLWLLEA